MFPSISVCLGSFHHISEKEYSTTLLLSHHFSFQCPVSYLFLLHRGKVTGQENGSTLLKVKSLMSLSKQWEKWYFFLKYTVESSGVELRRAKSNFREYASYVALGELFFFLPCALNFILKIEKYALFHFCTRLGKECNVSFVLSGRDIKHKKLLITA